MRIMVMMREPDKDKTRSTAARVVRPACFAVTRQHLRIDDDGDYDDGDYDDDDYDDGDLATPEFRFRRVMIIVLMIMTMMMMNEMALMI